MIRAGTIAALASAVLVGDVVALLTIDEDAATDAVTDSAAAPSDRPTRASTESLEGQLERVTDHVERIRELSFQTPPLVRQATRAELQADVEEQVSEYSAADASLDQALLVALGQLSPTTDLKALLVTAYGEQVAGYYDPETAELVVGTDDPTQRLGRLDEVTLAHELAHSLVDARVGLPDLEGFDEGQEDALLASQALVEGDATLLMNLYTEQAMSAIDALLLAQEALEMADTLASFTALPYVLQQSLQFPYVEGLGFVQALYDRGGWAAVDAAYDAPPTTTLEILDPARYGRVAPVDPSPPGDPGPAWTLERSLAVGALDLRILFDAPGDDLSRGLPGSQALALAWTGGAITQWSTDEGDAAFAMHVRHRPDVEMCQAFNDWWVAAFPDDGASVGQVGVIECADTEVRVGLAPTLDEANRAIGDGGRPS